jgi:hypothetical protein
MIGAALSSKSRAEVFGATGTRSKWQSEPKGVQSALRSRTPQYDCTLRRAGCSSSRGSAPVSADRNGRRSCATMEQYVSQ